MHKFSELLIKIEQAATNKSKVQELSEYFRTSSAGEASWAVFFLLANRMPKTINGNDLLALAQQVSGLPEWILQEAYQHVGDLAETATLIIKPHLSNSPCTFTLNDFTEQKLSTLKTLQPNVLSSEIIELWKVLDFKSCLLFNKLLLSNLRIPVTAQQLTLSLSEISGLPQSTIAARLTGKWNPDSQKYRDLISSHTEAEINSVSPQPFQTFHQIQSEISDLGEASKFTAMEKWDGIRAQVVNIPQACMIWTLTNEEISRSLPELTEKSSQLIPLNTILDGEIVACKDTRILSHNHLQRRLTRKQASKKLQQEVPVRFIADDILFFEGKDLREQTYAQRRLILEELFSDEALTELQISRPVEFSDWNQLREYRRKNSDCDLTIKDRLSPYTTTSNVKACWLWEKEPSSILAVLVYVGSNQGAASEYTFAVWKGDDLVPVARIRENLEEKLRKEITAFINENTLERFGPVRTLKPEMIFQISYSSVSESSRHKSGVTLRNPVVIRLCKEKSSKDIAKLNDLKSKLAGRL